MQGFDQLALDQDHSLPLLGGLGMGDDHLQRPLYVVRRRREDAIGHRDGFGMDQGLAVEAQFQPLQAGLFEPRIVVQIQMHAVQNGQPVGAGRQHPHGQRGQNR